MPSVINAPRTTLPAMPIASLGPLSASASPPAGKSPICDMNMSHAAASSADPMPICTLRRGSSETTPAPSDAPNTDAPMSSTSVSASTWTSVM
ncbi:MAG: hypothetical protein H6Q08_904 [Acidobacteria bacterium]|nr:hypothetical protein [Acidobacteriota bacterium]